MDSMDYSTRNLDICVPSVCLGELEMIMKDLIMQYILVLLAGTLLVIILASCNSIKVSGLREPNTTIGK